MDAGNRQVGARRVRDSADLASNNRALDGRRGMPERAGGHESACVLALKGVLVEKHSAVGGWVITWKSFLQRPVGDKTCPFLHPDNVPLAVEVTCQ